MARRSDIPDSSAPIFFLQNCYPSFGRDLSTVFSTFKMNQLGKIRPRRWKESLKLISKIAKFESDLLKTSENIQVSKVYRRLQGVGHKLFPNHTNISAFLHLREALSSFA